jgi:hypothetical protein
VRILTIGQDTLTYSQASTTRANAGEEGLGWLVGGILRDELAAEGTLENARRSTAERCSAHALEPSGVSRRLKLLDLKS